MRHRRSLFLGSFFVSFSLALISPFPQSQLSFAQERGTDGVETLGETPEEGAVIIIYDSSGSMWGPVSQRQDSARKYEIAQDVMTELIDDLGPSDLDLDIGIVGYGHRVKGACDDIETLVEPDDIKLPGHRAEMKAAIGDLIPKGSTPIAGALSFAAEALKYSERQATIVLVSDGIEECGGDPCAVARDLERYGLDFTAHVIGFGLDQQQLDALRCIADNTDGEIHPASDALALRKAFETLAARIEAAKYRSYLNFALVTDQGDPLPQHILGASTLRLTSLDPEVSSDRIVDLDGPTPQASVQPGRYRAVLRLPGLNKRQDFDAPRDVTTDVTFVVGPSAARLSVIDGQTRQPIDFGDVSWRIQSAIADHQGDGNPTELELDPGTYRVEAYLLGDVWTEEFELIPEMEADIAIVLETGQVDVSGSAIAPEYFADLAASPVELELRRLSESGPVEITAGAGAISQRVPTGRYEAEGVYAGSVKRVSPFEVLDEDELSVDIPFGPGILNARGMNLDGEPLSRNAPASWTIEPLFGDGRPAAPSVTIGGTEIQPTLPPGRYRVTLSLPTAENQTELEIEAENTSEIELMVHEPS